MEKEKTIYDLELHESMDVESLGKDATTYFQVMRVPGGRIYTYWNTQTQSYDNRGIFVPFNNRFQGV